MFLKNCLSNLVYPNFCCCCHQKLKKTKLLCSDCQNELYLNFELGEAKEHSTLGTVQLLFSTASSVKSLWHQIQNPFNAFLYPAFAALFLFKLIQINFWPDFLLRLAPLNWIHSSPLLEIQKNLAKFMQIPLKKLGELRNEKGEVLWIALKWSDLENFHDSLIQLKEKTKVSILVAQAEF